MRRSLLVLALVLPACYDRPSAEASRAESRAARVEDAAPGHETIAGQPAYFEFQLDSTATPLDDNPRPEYPRALRAAHVEGKVLAQFIVNERGTVDIATLKVLESSDPAFTRAVREVLPRLRFIPARMDGKPVRQVVQMPFTFGGR